MLSGPPRHKVPSRKPKTRSGSVNSFCTRSCSFTNSVHAFFTSSCFAQSDILNFLTMTPLGPYPRGTNRLSVVVHSSSGCGPFHSMPYPITWRKISFDLCNAHVIACAAMQARRCGAEDEKRPYTITTYIQQCAANSSPM